MIAVFLPFTLSVDMGPCNLSECKWNLLPTEKNLSVVVFQFTKSRPTVWPYELQHARFPCPLLSPSLLKLISIVSVMLSKHLNLFRPLLLLPSIFPSIRVFSIELALHIRWPKYWSFSISISPSNEYSGLISFGIDWFDLLAEEGTLKGLLQHHNSKGTIWCSAFFMVQLSHLYIFTTGKTIALTIHTFVSKVMSLLWIHCLGLS